MREKKKDRAYEEIRKLILTRETSEGVILSENSLAAELEMSRTPVREALQRLQMEGFLEIHPNRGVTIPEVSVVEVNETFALRMAIEEFVIKEIIPLMTEEHFLQVDEILRRQRESMERKDVLEYLRHDKDFHDFYLRLYSNALIFSTIKRVRDRFFSMGTAVLRGPGTVERSFVQHSEIARAVRQRDSGEAAAAMHRHMVTGRGNILSLSGTLEKVL